MYSLCEYGAKKIKVVINSWGGAVIDGMSIFDAILNVGCQVDTYNAPAVGMQDFPAFDSEQATVYRYRQQQSVNLGSWCVQSFPTLAVRADLPAGSYTRIG